MDVEAGGKGLSLIGGEKGAGVLEDGGLYEREGTLQMEGASGGQ